MGPAMQRVPPSQRPLFLLTLPQLRQYAEQFSESPRKLANVYFELHFRRRQSAAELRQLVRLLMLSHGKPFSWPSPDIIPGDGILDQGVFNVDSGFMRLIGYRVGVAGVGERQRHDLLVDAFTEEQPALRGHPQEHEWSTPRSSRRLEKMANVIAALTRNAKRRTRPPKVAIQEWQADLAFLKRTIYDGHFDFNWPGTEA